LFGRREFAHHIAHSFLEFRTSSLEFSNHPRLLGFDSLHFGFDFPLHCGKPITLFGGEVNTAERIPYASHAALARYTCRRWLSPRFGLRCCGAGSSGESTTKSALHRSLNAESSTAWRLPCGCTCSGTAKPAAERTHSSHPSHGTCAGPWPWHATHHRRRTRSAWHATHRRRTRSTWHSRHSLHHHSSSRAGHPWATRGATWAAGLHGLEHLQDLIDLLFEFA
jgi:hypothetical protein